MSTIRGIVLPYGTQYAILVHMLQETLTPRREMFERHEAQLGRLSPWLNWRPKRRRSTPVLSVAELAECTCPDLCDRDHPNE
jgi:hypothetical protein